MDLRHSLYREATANVSTMAIISCHGMTRSGVDTQAWCLCEPRSPR